MAKPELQDEINALIKGIAEALALPTDTVALAFQENRAAIDFVSDDQGRHFIDVTLDGRSARIGLKPAPDA